MKRTPLKRKTPLKVHTTLKRKTPLRSRGKAGTSKKVKSKHRPLRTIKRDLTTVFNRFVRLRAASAHPGLLVCCVTCDKWFDWTSIEAGHFNHNNAASQYDERAVHPQCHRCNCRLHGNLGRYAMYLVKRYGSYILVVMDVLSREKKRWTATELEGMLAEYRPKLKELERKCGIS